MSASYDVNNEPQLQPRSPYPYARPQPIPDIRIEGLLQERGPSLIPRDSSSSTNGNPSSTFSCGPKDTTGPCERSTSSTDNTTLPIVLGVLIPLGVAFIAMIILHRRHVRKLRREDAEDKHKSLDFGLGEGGPMRSKKSKKGPKSPKVPEMSMADTRNAIRRDRGLSMDMDMTNPYMPPPGLHQSRESLHSLSRNFPQGDDKYGRTNFIPDDGSIRSPSVMRRHGDDSSSYTGSSRPRLDSESSKTLVRSNTDGSGLDSKFGKETSPAPLTRQPPPPKGGLLAPAGPDGRASVLSTTSDAGAAAAFRKSNDYLGMFIRGGNSAPAKGTKELPKQPEPVLSEVKLESTRDDSKPNLPIITMNENPISVPSPVAQPNTAEPRVANSTPEREPQLPQLNFANSAGSSNKDLFPEISVTEHKPDSQPSSTVQSSNPSRHESQQYTPHMSIQSPQRHESQDYYHDQHHYQHDSQQYQQHDSQQYPQHDSKQYQQHDSQQYPVNGQQYDDDYYDPEDTYSVYDEYGELGYDQRRSMMGMRPLPPDDPSENPEQRANRIRSFYKEYFDESGRNPQAAYDMGYYDGSEYYDDYYNQDQYYPPRGHSSAGGRHRATFSNGSHQPGQRAFSSASARYNYPPHARPRPRGPPKKKTVPPKALNALPTPSKLKDDTFLIDQAIDFAPPLRAAMQRSGTPDSGRGGARPYSPTVRAHIPLASSYDDLAVMPSPHLLRKSGTFTGLDFAPPRFRPQGDNVSDAGSIRSARSGTSLSTQHAIRAGAYRISRIPKDVVFTPDAHQDALKPRWDMNR